MFFIIFIHHISKSSIVYYIINGFFDVIPYHIGRASVEHITVAIFFNTFCRREVSLKRFYNFAYRYFLYILSKEIATLSSSYALYNIIFLSTEKICSKYNSDNPDFSDIMLKGSGVFLSAIASSKTALSAYLPFVDIIIKYTLRLFLTIHTYNLRIISSFASIILSFVSNFISFFRYGK